MNAEVQNKVMFFLWDSVFTTSKKPLAKLLGVDETSLVTFGEFASHTDRFVIGRLKRIGADVPPSRTRHRQCRLTPA